MELSRTVREVVKDRVPYYASESTAVRISALVTGVLGPLVLAYLVHRSRAHSEPTADEVLEVLQRHGLIDVESDRRLLGSRKDRPLLAGAREDGQDGDETTTS